MLEQWVAPQVSVPVDAPFSDTPDEISDDGKSQPQVDAADAVSTCTGVISGDEFTEDDAPVRGSHGTVEETMCADAPAPAQRPRRNELVPVLEMGRVFGAVHKSAALSQPMQPSQKASAVTAEPPIHGATPTKL